MERLAALFNSRLLVFLLLAFVLLWFSGVKAESAPDIVLKTDLPTFLAHGLGTDCIWSEKAEIADINALLAGNRITLAMNVNQAPGSSDTTVEPTVTASANCTPQMFRFAADRRVARLFPAPGTGTYMPGTDGVASTPRPFVVGLKFHLLMAPGANQQDRNDIKVALNWSVAKLRKTYYGNQTGILFFVNSHIKPLTGDVSTARQMVKDVNAGTVTPSALLDKLRELDSQDSGSSGFSPGILNVYVLGKDPGSEEGYALSASGFRGYFAGGAVPADQFFIVISESAPPSTLAHELGHAFSLGHVNITGADQLEYCFAYDGIDGICDYTRNNVMWAGEGRNDNPMEFTRAQVLRMALNKTSLINLQGRIARDFSFPVQEQWECPDYAISQTCPFLGGP